MKKTTDNHLLIFDLPHPNNGEKLISAELKVLTLVDQVGTGNAILLLYLCFSHHFPYNSIFVLGVRQAKLSVYDDVTKTLNYTQKIHFEHSSNTWLTFNVTLPVTNIFQNNKKYIKIILSISSLFSYSFNNLNALKLSLMPLNAALEDNVEHDYPVLILSYASSEKILKKTRKKRGLEEEYEEETNKVWDNEEMEQKYEKKLKKTKNMCKRRPLYINFSEIDFDLWIIQPTGYEVINILYTPAFLRNSSESRFLNYFWSLQKKKSRDFYDVTLTLRVPKCHFIPYSIVIYGNK